MMAIDLTTADGTSTYLKEHTAFDVGSVDVLSGGYCNYVWRVKLNTPYQGHTSFVLKHAEGFSASDKSMKFDVERQTFEYQALKTVSESGLLDEDGLITVPNVFHYDAEYHVLLMGDAGNIPTLQDYLSSHPPPPADITDILAVKLAEFIASLHLWGRNNDTARLRLSGNTPARTGYSSVEYGSIIPLAVEYGVSDPLLQTVVNMLTEEALNSEETLIMGDFWLGNILVDIQDNADGSKVLKRVWVIDWDMCRYGSPASDIVTVAGDCFLISRFKDPSTGDVFRQTYLKTYASLAKVDPYRVVLGMGAHWIMFTKILGWSSEAETRECIEQGVEYIHRGWDKSIEWISTSLARELVVG